jgi:hypothetical protein
MFTRIATAAVVAILIGTAAQAAAPISRVPVITPPHPAVVVPRPVVAAPVVPVTRTTTITHVGNMVENTTVVTNASGKVVMAYSSIAKSQTPTSNTTPTAEPKPANSQAPQTWANVDKQSPSAVRQFLSHYQPTNTSAGIYAPWMTKNPYGAPMAGKPGQRAVACGC